MGRDCQIALGLHELVCLNRRQLDIADTAAVECWLGRTRPAVVVNCAAYTAVDRAEDERDLCYRVNRDGPATLARVCAAQGARLIHISTDYVFDGQLPLARAYTEEHPTSPLGVYGASKLAGEEAVLAYEGGYVLRTAWLYGESGPNFLQAILRRALLAPSEPLRVVNDQHGAPTWSGRLARQIAHIIAEEAPAGLYHASAGGAATWYDVAVAFFSSIGLQHAITPIPTSAYPTRARRPVNSRLHNRNLERAYLDVMIDWRQDLTAFAKHFGEHWIERIKHEKKI